MGKVYKSGKKHDNSQTLSKGTTVYGAVDFPQSFVNDYPLDTALAMVSEKISVGEMNASVDLLLELKRVYPQSLELHEMLADCYLQNGDLVAAREYSQHCARMIEQTLDVEIFSIKDFRILLAEAGDFADTKKEFDAIKSAPITNENYLQGTKLALSLATHYMAEKKYKEAEILLSEYRDSYLDYISKDIY